MHKDPEFKKLCEDVASATNVDKILEEVNRGDHGKVIVMTNCGRLLVGGNPETRGKYILDAKDAQGFLSFVK